MSESGGWQDFELHPRLKSDCIELGCFTLSRLLLMNERRSPWFILVPQRSGISELHQLAECDQMQLMRESSALATYLSSTIGCDKLNIASLGNLVPQLHIHHVLRYRNDPAWPAPVWGRFDPEPYDTEALGDIARRFNSADIPGFKSALQPT